MENRRGAKKPPPPPPAEDTVKARSHNPILRIRFLVPKIGRRRSDGPESEMWIFARRAMVDQAREGLCYQRINLTFLICLT